MYISEEVKLKKWNKWIPISRLKKRVFQNTVLESFTESEYLTGCNIFLLISFMIMHIILKEVFLKLKNILNSI